MTSDEDSWMRRAGGFAYGVSQGRLGRTYQNGHPGVLTMELAIASQGPDGAERFADPITGNPRFVTKVPGFFEALVEARRGFAIVGALLVALVALLVWRLLGPGPAIFGGLLLALDPWLVAHAQLVHTDGLLAMLMVAAIGCALVGWARDGGRSWVAASGLLAGLASLTKVPAVYLAAFVPLLALFYARTRAWRSLAADLGVWGTVVLASYVALWPSLWLDPIGTLARMIEFTRETGGQPDEVGSFFLGQAWGDPGPLFYPVALAFRLTPLCVLGLLALAAFGRSRRRELSGRWGAVLWLAVYALGFLLFVTIAPKKFDRYALPIMPVLDIVAGLGLWLAWRGAFSPRLRVTASPRLAAAACAILLAAVWPLAASYPYHMAYFNPLLGGGLGAAHVVMVGNGEGMDQAAEYLNRLPNAEQLRVASHSFDLLTARCRCDGEPLREDAPRDADYIVLYGRRIQLRRWGAGLERYLQGRQPVERIWINGIEMVRIYQGPRLGQAAG
jgi:4-amino-4-deoxy-L-arabinose transferase-like glycosyltransferase